MNLRRCAEDEGLTSEGYPDKIGVAELCEALGQEGESQECTPMHTQRNPTAGAREMGGLGSSGPSSGSHASCIKGLKHTQHRPGPGLGAGGSLAEATGMQTANQAADGPGLGGGCERLE